MLMAISTVAAYLPAAQETAEASSWSYGFNSNYIYFSDESKDLSEYTSMIVVEKGNTTLDLRDMLYGYRYNDSKWEEFTGTELDGIKFESKNTDILSVDSKTGKINAKKTGTALVKITWKKQSIYGVIKVLSKSDMKAYRTENKKAIAYCKKITKAYGSKLTAKSALKVQKLVLQMYQDDAYVFYDWKEESIGDDNYVEEMIIYSMDAFNAWKKVKKVWSYLSDRSPFATSGSYKFKISSLSGSGKTVTATLSKAVTEDQMAGAQYNYIWGEEYEKMGKKSLDISVYLWDKKTNEVIPATATIKTGSKTIKIKCDSSLTKGRKYELLSYDYSDWGNDEWTTSDWIRDDWLHNGKSTFKAT
jgi:hypothetical protein